METSQPRDFSLLEFLSAQAGCDYLSDLHFLQEGQRRHLAEAIEKTSSQAFSLRCWNDALFYLTGKVPEATQEAARSSLLAYLAPSRS